MNQSPLDAREHRNAKAPVPVIDARTTRHRFTLCGVAFEVLADSRVVWALGQDAERLMLPIQEGSVVAHALCSVSVHDGIPVSGSTPRLWQRAAGHARFEGAGVRVALTHSAGNHLAATMQVAPTGEALRTALLTVLGEALQSAGGLLLHATAVDFEGRAVLFIGPSGAGKSTAADLLQHAHCLSYDRAALLPTAHGYRVLALPGGTAPRLPETAHHSLPLAAILRVRHELPAVTFLPQHGMAALFALRTALLDDDNPALEEQRFERLRGVVASSAFGTLHTVLGQRYDAQLRQFLSQHAPAHLAGAQEIS